MARGLPVLIVRNLKKYFDEHRVLEDVSFEVHHGEILGLMGGSGSGKSMTLKSIIGLEKPDSGTVIFEGRKLTQLSERELYQVRVEIGYVFQSGALFDSMTLEDNLAYPLRKHTNSSAEEIHAQINERLKTLDMVGSNDLYPSQISGGMQKRAGLARATMLRPKVVLFDEPTAGLDPVNIRRLVHNMRRYRRGADSREFLSLTISGRSRPSAIASRFFVKVESMRSEP